MKLLKDFSSKKLKDAIKEDFPCFKIKSIKFMDRSWDNAVVEINKEYIFRFPKDKNVNFKLEKKILDYFKDKISIAIPKIEFTGKYFAYMGYRKIPGETLTNEVFDTLSNDQKEKLFFDPANFLCEIHTTLGVEKAKKMGVAEEDMLSYENLIKSALYKKITDKVILNFIKSIIKEYEKIIKEKAELVFLYNPPALIPARWRWELCL